MNPFRTPNSGARSPILAAVPTVAGEGSVSMRLYDAIDPWGGDWGISAKEFVAALDSLPKDTAEIRLLINSPGGSVFDALAILNALRSHQARVVAVVEGIAASAASFIAAGVDELVMARNSELFIHNAWDLAVGNAEDLRKVADDLDHFDANLASIYARKSGDPADHWLGVMAEEQWFSAEEAVAAKLADRIEGEGDAKSAKARFDLSVFARARADSKRPGSTEPDETNRKENVVAYGELKAGLGKRLGVTDAENLSDDELLAAVDEALAEAVEEDEGEKPAVPVVPDGAVLVEAEALAALRQDAALGREARAEQIKARHESLVNAAINDGKVPPKSRQKWLDALAENEAKTAAILDEFEPNTIPVDEIGEMPAGELTADDAIYDQLFGAGASAAFKKEGQRG